MNRPGLTEIERYALGLLTEEAGEINQLVGKSMRFGIDIPNPKDPERGSARDHLNMECGDMIAAIKYAIERGVIDKNKVLAQAAAKFGKLIDPEALDLHGRKLAP